LKWDKEDCKRTKDIIFFMRGEDLKKEEKEAEHG